MRRFQKVLSVSAGVVLATSLLLTPEASAAVPPGCGTAHEVNRAPIMYGVGSSSWRVGTIIQYWGWCNSQLRNWAHVDFSAGNSALGTRVAIQTRNGNLHGAKTHDSGTSFNSAPADTLDVDTRAYVDGNFWNGGVATLSPAQHTGWSGS
jgi:hypothetical protein